MNINRQPPSLLGDRPVSRAKITPTQPMWLRFASCVGNSDLFFGASDENDRQRGDRETRAIAICAACPARLACRDYGRLHRESGIWGGETDIQRRRSRRGRVSLRDTFPGQTS
jgi:WhiB family redox-sensing transcriptional regulator